MGTSARGWLLSLHCHRGCCSCAGCSSGYRGMDVSLVGQGRTARLSAVAWGKVPWAMWLGWAIMLFIKVWQEGNGNGAIADSIS